MNVTVRLLLIFATASLAMPAGALVPDDLLELRTCRLQALSPDGARVVFSVASFDRETGQDRATVYLRDLDQARDQVLFAPDDQAGGFVFSPDGSQLVFTRVTDDGTEVWLMDVEGGNRRNVAGPGEYGDLVWSPDGRTLAHLVSVRDPEYEGLVDTVTVADDLGWRHLGSGERQGHLRQLHLLDIESGEETALATWQLDLREIAWSPRSNHLVASAKPRRRLGRTLGSELYIITSEDGIVRRLTNNPGPDVHPIWLEDGAIACQSHADSLHESEPAHLVVRDSYSRGEIHRYLRDFGDCVWGVWHHDDRFYVRAPRRGTLALFAVEDDGVRQLTPDGWDCWEVRFGGGRAMVQASSQTSPDVLWSVDLVSGKTTLLVDPNESWKARTHLTEPQRFEVTVDGRQIEGWVFLPEEHDFRRPPPAVLSIHGGPEWMYGGYFLPEFHLLPSLGYTVLAANPTGSTGYGREFLDDIRGDWIGRPARELMAVVDHAVAQGWADRDLLAVMGGSYGGHLAAALTTQTDRFRAAACDRMYPQVEAFWGATDEKWFPEWEFGGRPFDPGAREVYERNDPFRQVAQVRTPTLLSHGLYDFRCPQDGTVGWYSALQSLGVPTRLLRFHDEAHGIRGRANQVFYLEQLLSWFDKWLLGEASRD